MKRTYHPWDLGRAAFSGILAGVVFSVMEELGYRAFAGMSSGEIVLSLSGRLLALAALFAAVAFIRNVIARRRSRPAN
jgi:hypothetical protein